jgi:hypothetical protein
MHNRASLCVRSTCRLTSPRCAVPQKRLATGASAWRRLDRAPARCLNRHGLRRHGRIGCAHEPPVLYRAPQTQSRTRSGYFSGHNQACLSARGLRAADRFVYAPRPKGTQWRQPYLTNRVALRARLGPSLVTECETISGPGPAAGSPAHRFHLRPVCHSSCSRA